MKKFSLIAAIAKDNLGIGYKGQLPWGRIPEDMARFKQITANGAIIMGRKTYESIGRKLPNRTNIVISRSLCRIGDIKNNQYASYHIKPDGTYICNSFDKALELAQSYEPITVIGGTEIYRTAMHHPYCDKLYITFINQLYTCDTYFPQEFYKLFEELPEETIEYNSTHSMPSEDSITFKTYQSIYNINSEENQYLCLIREIINTGEIFDGRNGRTKAIFGSPQHTFDLQNGFPLLTTKKMFYKGIIKELLFFLRGDTNSKILEEQGVRIWTGNTTREFLDSRGLSGYEEGEMGPMYGYQWRYWGKNYLERDNVSINGYDQLRQLIDGLINEPNSRRHLLTTFNPADVDISVLAPCHGLIIQFHVRDGKYLDCKMYQRSVDVGLGYPFNIASYAALVHIIAHVCKYEPGKLYMTLGNTHIYEEHIDALSQQIERIPLKFPQFKVIKEFSAINDTTTNTNTDMTTNIAINFIENLTVDDFELSNYVHHEPIKMNMIA